LKDSKLPSVDATAASFSESELTEVQAPLRPGSPSFAVHWTAAGRLLFEMTPPQQLA
jgi:hypothetical protein